MLSRKGGCGLRSVTPPCVIRAYDADDDDGGATAAVAAVSASACATPTADASYRRDPEYAQWWHHQRDKPARLLPPLVDAGNVLAVYCREIRTGQPSPPPLPPPPPPPPQETAASAAANNGPSFAPLQEPVYPAPIYEMEQHRLKHRCTVLSQRGAMVQHLPYNSSNEDDDTSSHNSSAVNSTAHMSASAYRPPFMRLETPTTPALEPTAAAAAAAPAGTGQVCGAGEAAQQWGYGGDGRDEGLQAYSSGSYGSYYDYLFECECGTMTHSSLGYCSGCGFVPPPTGSGVQQQQSQSDVDDMLALRYADSNTSVLTCDMQQQPQQQQQQPAMQQQQQPQQQQQQQQPQPQQQQQHLPAAPRQQPIILSPVQGTGNSGGGGSARGSGAPGHVKRHPAHGQGGGSPRHYHPPHPAAARPISPCSSSLTASTRSIAYQRSSSSGCLSMCLDSMEGSTSFVSPNPTPTSTPQKVKVTVATPPPAAAAVPDLYNDDASPASPHGIEAYLGYY